MSVIEALKHRLGNHPELRFRATATSVEIEAPSSDGFTVGLWETSNDYVVHFEGWHEHFRSGDEALACIRFAYSGKCRLAITYRGRMPVKWVVESLKGANWVADSEVGHFLIPFWRRPYVVYRQNPKALEAS